MCASIFNQSPRAEGFPRTPLAGFVDGEDLRDKRFAAPWSMQKRGPLPYATTLEAMEQVARAQMEDFGGAAAGRGGRLLVAELTKDCVSVRSQCDLEAATSLKHGAKSAPACETGAGHAVVFGRQ